MVTKLDRLQDEKKNHSEKEEGGHLYKNILFGINNKSFKKKKRFRYIC